MIVDINTRIISERMTYIPLIAQPLYIYHAPPCWEQIESIYKSYKNRYSGNNSKFAAPYGLRRNI